MEPLNNSQIILNGDFGDINERLVRKDLQQSYPLIHHKELENRVLAQFGSGVVHFFTKCDATISEIILSDIALPALDAGANCGLVSGGGKALLLSGSKILKSFNSGTIGSFYIGFNVVFLAKLIRSTENEEFLNLRKITLSAMSTGFGFATLNNGFSLVTSWKKICKFLSFGSIGFCFGSNVHAIPEVIRTIKNNESPNWRKNSFARYKYCYDIRYTVWEFGVNFIKGKDARKY